MRRSSQQLAPFPRPGQQPFGDHRTETDAVAVHLPAQLRLAPPVCMADQRGRFVDEGVSGHHHRQVHVEVLASARTRPRAQPDVEPAQGPQHVRAKRAVRAAAEHPGRERIQEVVPSMLTKVEAVVFEALPEATEPFEEHLGVGVEREWHDQSGRAGHPRVDKARQQEFQPAAVDLDVVIGEHDQRRRDRGETGIAGAGESRGGLGHVADVGEPGPPQQCRHPAVTRSVVDHDDVRRAYRLGGDARQRAGQCR